MDKESQYLLFALSSPMEVLNEDCLPSHSSPKMYLGIKRFDLESSWGIENRDELLQTISRMTDDGHATQLEWLYRLWFRYAPQEWQEYTDTLDEEIVFMPDSSLIPPCVAVKAVFAAGIMCGWDFSAAWAYSMNG